MTPWNATAPEARAGVLNAYLAGELTVKEIGAEFGVSYRTVERIVSAAGKSYSRQRRPAKKGTLA